MAAAVNQFARNDAIRQNSAVVVNVFEKEIQRGDALRQAVLDLAPLLVGNDPRQQIVRKDPLRALVVAVDRERDALVQKRQVGRLLALAQFLGRKLQQRLKQSLIVRAGVPGAANISS